MLLIVAGLLVMGLVGCTSVNHGIIDERTFYCTDNPNIRIDVADGFEMNQDSERSNLYTFINLEEHRLIQIDYVKRSFQSKQNIEHYYNPMTWIFYKIPDCKELDKGEMRILGKKWFYRDLVHHQSTASCALVRDLGYFTADHDVLKIIYAQDLPPYDCASWKNIENLNSKQHDRVKRFLHNMEADIKISNYVTDPAPQ